MTWSDEQLDSDLGFEGGPWVTHLKTAWRASVSAQSIRLPQKPRTGVGEWEDWHKRSIAYWAGPLDLLIYGLGWTRPDLGLLRWLELDDITEDPILRTLWRWWRGRSGVIEFLAWAQNSSLGLELADAVGVSSRRSSLPLIGPWRDLNAIQETSAWQATWAGGSDTFHLSGSTRMPLDTNIPRWEAPRALREEASIDAAGNEMTSDAAIICNVYPGWYRALIEEMPGSRVDVYVRPIGWLGTFRQSSSTTLWHRCINEEIHNWGNWAG